MTWTLVAQLAVLALVAALLLAVVVSMACDAARDVAAILASRHDADGNVERLPRRRS